MSHEPTLDEITQEAVAAALDVIDRAYLLSGHNVRMLGDSLGILLERQVRAALFQFDESQSNVPAFTNASSVQGIVTFHDGRGTAWQFARIHEGLGIAGWSVASRRYPGLGPFVPSAVCWVQGDTALPAVLFEAFEQQCRHTSTPPSDP